MEPVSWLVGLLVMVGSGSLAKVGENITDATVNLAQSILSRKAPDSQTAKSNVKVTGDIDLGDLTQEA